LLLFFDKLFGSVNGSFKHLSPGKELRSQNMFFSRNLACQFFHPYFSISQFVGTPQLFNLTKILSKTSFLVLEALEFVIHILHVL
jgi:hypothetical protein